MLTLLYQYTVKARGYNISTAVHARKPYIYIPWTRQHLIIYPPNLSSCTLHPLIHNHASQPKPSYNHCGSRTIHLPVTQPLPLKPKLAHRPRLTHRAEASSLHRRNCKTLSFSSSGAHSHGRRIRPLKPPLSPRLGIVSTGWQSRCTLLQRRCRRSNRPHGPYS